MEVIAERASTPFYIAAVLVFLVYFSWWSVALWRCAANSTPLWKTLSRLYLLYSIGRMVWDIAMVFAAA